jgi:hypothetical protein
MQRNKKKPRQKAGALESITMITQLRKEDHLARRYYPERQKVKPLIDL